MGYKLVKRYDCGDIRPEEWLDVMAFRQIENIHKVDTNEEFKGGNAC
jgi:hypothetical protein